MYNKEKEFRELLKIIQKKDILISRFCRVNLELELEFNNGEKKEIVYKLDPENIGDFTLEIFDNLNNLLESIDYIEFDIKEIYENLKQISVIDYDFNYFGSKYEITDDTPLYSSYHRDTDINKKDYIWCSYSLDQSILHPFNKLRTRQNIIEPLIYRFNIKDSKNFIIIQSQMPNLYNYDIFNAYLSKDCIRRIFEYYKKEDNNIEILDTDYREKFLNEDNNYRILLILEVINHLLDGKLVFYGYHNYNDQKEIAFINNGNLIQNITGSKYKEIKYYNENISNDEIIQFPITLNDNNKKIFGSYNTVGYSEISEHGYDKFRMFCDNLKYIKYESFDDKSQILIYNCKKRSEYYEQKYLKYKSKYIKLKLNI